MCQILLVWFGRPILDTFLIISWDSVHIFQNRFLRWNRESKPVDLNTMNPTIWTIFFFTYKGARATFGVASGNSSRQPRELKFFLVSPMTYSNGKKQRANSNSNILFFWTPLVYNHLESHSVVKSHTGSYKVQKIHKKDISVICNLYYPFVASYRHYDWVLLLNVLI